MQQGLSPAQPAGVFSHEPEKDEYAHLKPQSFANWSASDPPALEWLVDGLIPMGTVTFLSGDGGLGKTQLGQQLVLAAALGASWCGKPCSRCRPSRCSARTRPTRSAVARCGSSKR